MYKNLIGVILASALTVSAIFAQRDMGARPTDSGGVLIARTGGLRRETLRFGGYAEYRRTVN